MVWDGQKYQLKPQLAQTFPDTWVPVGKISVIANASGLVLPVIHAVVTGGAIVAYQIINPGNGLTAAPVLTITDSSGSGATATAVVSAGAVTQVTPGSAGSGYSSTPDRDRHRRRKRRSRRRWRRHRRQRGEALRQCIACISSILTWPAVFTSSSCATSAAIGTWSSLPLAMMPALHAAPFIPKTISAALDPAAAVRQINEALNTSQQQMLIYAGKHGLAVK